MLPKHFEAMRKRHDMIPDWWPHDISGAIGEGIHKDRATCLAAMDVLWKAASVAAACSRCLSCTSLLKQAMAKVEAMGDGKT